MHLPPSAILVVVALVALQRGGELWLARHLLARSREESGAQPSPDPVLPAMTVLHTAWLVGCGLEPLLWPRPVPAALVLAAALLWVAALALRVWTLRTLGRFWHVRVIRRAQQPVITGGPYRFIRHPNYLVVLVEVAAVPLLLGAYGTALVASALNAVLLALRIRHEEAYLLGLPAYRAAFAHKARLLPGLF